MLITTVEQDQEDLSRRIFFIFLLRWCNSIDQRACWDYDSLSLSHIYMSYLYLPKFSSKSTSNYSVSLSWLLSSLLLILLLLLQQICQSLDCSLIRRTYLRPGFRTGFPKTLDEILNLVNLVYPEYFGTGKSLETMKTLLRFSVACLNTQHWQF